MLPPQRLFTKPLIQITCYQYGTIDNVFFQGLIDVVCESTAISMILMDVTNPFFYSAGISQVISPISMT